MVIKQVADGHELRLHHDRHPDFHAQSGLASLKQRRRNSHDRVGMLVELDRLAQNVAVRAEMRLPQTIADHRYRGASRLLILLGKKTAAEHRPYAQHIEIIRGCDHTPDALRLAFAREAHGRKYARGESCKALLSVAHGFEVWIRKAQRRISGLALRKRQDLARVRDSGYGIQQRGIDPTEDGGIRADPERQG